MKPLKLKINRKLFVFLFFLIISTLLWLLNALNQTYTARIDFPVSFQKMPLNKINVSNLPENFQLQINANGFTILKYKFKNKFIPLKFDVSSLKLESFSKHDSTHSYILTRELSEIVENQIKMGTDVETIKPDTIFFHFTQTSTKKVPVALDEVSILFAKQFMQKEDIVITPDTITISGPQAILDTIYWVYTEPKEYKLSDNINQSLKLQKLDKIVFSDYEINLIVEVEQYTEVKISVPIKIINIPNNIEDVKIFPNKVLITYLVGKSHYGEISKDEFKPIIDYESKNLNISNKLKIQIHNKPDDVKSFTYFPKWVDFIIK